MERNCLFCETPIDKKKHGLVKFCSTQCRNKYYYLNKPMKDIQDNENNSSVNKQVTQTLINEEQRNVLSGNLEQKSVIPENNNEWRRNLPNTSRGILDNDIIRYLEENYKTKAELFASQIRLENAIKEIEILRQKNLELENELDEDEDQSGILGALNHIPEWLQPAIGSILKSEKIQNFIIGLIPEEQKN
jgi:hypothetical protein